MEVDKKIRVKTLSIKELAKFSREICVQNYQQTTLLLSQICQKRILCSWTKQIKLASLSKEHQFHLKGCWLQVSSQKRANFVYLFCLFGFPFCNNPPIKGMEVVKSSQELFSGQSQRWQVSITFRVTGLSHYSVVPFSNFRWPVRDVKP